MSAPVILRSLTPVRYAASIAPKLRAGASPRRFASPLPAHSVTWGYKRQFSQSSFLQAKKYTEQHEWVELADDGSTATIGITDYAAKALGDVVFVELPAVDTEVSAGDTLGAVESVKSASDIASPVTGTVVEANVSLEEKPKTINDSPEGDGWIARVKVTDSSELEGLMDAKGYQASLEEEE